MKSKKLKKHNPKGYWCSKHQVFHKKENIYMSCSKEKESEKLDKCPYCGIDGWCDCSGHENGC